MIKICAQNSIESNMSWMSKQIWESEQRINNFNQLILIIIFSQLMSYRSSYSYLPLFQQNPETQVHRTVKMHNLLEEYDRQNAFLNQQVSELLRLNKLLTTAQKIQPKVAQKSKRKQSLPKKYSYLNELKGSLPKSLTNSTLFKTQQKPMEKDHRPSRNIDDSVQKKKKVQFTCEPYIQKSEVRPLDTTNNEMKKSVIEIVQEKLLADDDANSPLKKHSQTKVKEVSGIQAETILKSSLKKRKSGIQVVNRSPNKDKSMENNKSNVSIKSSRSRKSGISVASKGEKVQIPYSSIKQIELDSNKKTKPVPPPDNKPVLSIQRPLDLKLETQKSEILQCPAINKNNASNIKSNNEIGLPNKKITFTQVQTQPVSIAPIQSAYQLTNNFIKLPPPNPYNSFSRTSSISNLYDRSQGQSKHRITPSNQIHKSTNSQNTRKLSEPKISGQKQGKKKFLTLLTKKLIEDSKELKKKQSGK